MVPLMKKSQKVKHRFRFFGFLKEKGRDEHPGLLFY